jgi:multidrug efflux pump subunit AcrB
VLAAAVAILLLLQAAFASWSFALLFAATLPFALAGGVLAAGAKLSFGALVGLLAVLGLALRFGLVLVRRCQELERDGETRLDAVVDAAGDRLVPIATTAVATGLALAPLLVLGDVPGRELPLVVLGGLVTTVLHALAVVPAAYLLAGSAAEDAVVDELVAVRA